MADACIFCDPQRDLLAENGLALAFLDSYPVSPGHALIVPRRHAVTIWDLATDEYAACFDLVRQVRTLLESRHKPDGFNVGVNCGEVAGQSVMHAHIHLIPRYKGDVQNPRGGVRYVVPHKGHY